MFSLCSPSRDVRAKVKSTSCYFFLCFRPNVDPENNLLLSSLFRIIIFRCRELTCRKAVNAWNLGSMDLNSILT